MSNRNIRLVYVLAAAKRSWFWLGIWVFYYLRFTNYAGIGILETILVVTFTLTEIPTGAIADLLGKKKALILAFLFQAAGAFIMAAAQNFEMLALSVGVMCVGGSLYSGTADALVFDSLKEEGKEKLYDKKISNINTIQLIVPAICSIIGGYLYTISPSLPFYANGVGYVLGLCVALFLIEPHIDTEKFSMRNFITQNKQGLKQLFNTSEMKRYTLLLISIASIIVISWEMLDAFLAFEFGFNEVQLGILTAILFVISAGASQLTPLLRKRLQDNTLVFILGIGMGITFILSPFLGLVFGGVSLALRASFQSIFENTSSIIINNHTESKYRATTLSTFNMMSNVPYVLGAYLVGVLADVYSARYMALVLGVAMLVLLVAQVKFMKKKTQL